MSKYNVSRTVDPAVEPLTLGETKDHLKVDPSITEDNDLIEGAIVAARQLAESQTRRQLITQTWLITLPSFPWGSNARFHAVGIPGSWLIPIELPIAPIQSITFVRYYDENNALQILASDLYDSDLRSARPRIRMWADAWPRTYQRMEAVEIEVIAGYGDAPADVPRAIRQWMLCAVTAMYEHRDIVTERGALQMNPFLDGLLDPYRFIEI